ARAPSGSGPTSPRPPRRSVLLHFQHGESGVLTLRCDVLRLPDGFVLVGEPSWDRHQALERELTAVVNDFEVLERASAAQARELGRARAELQASLDELERSHWHIRKISEFLPICVSCSKVRAENAGWEPLVDYLRRNTLFLSHGYCPTCAEAVLANMRLPRGGEED
ncbi:MAG: hypothetical protein ACK4YP_27255, partial [Myxococcota bacterium]